MKSKKKYAEKFVGITPKEEGGFEDRQKKVLEIFSQTFKKSLIKNIAQTSQETLGKFDRDFRCRLRRWKF